jgi:hypothetical protein
MRAQRSHRAIVLTIGLACILSAWGTLGVFGPRAGFTDPLFEPDYTIQHLRPGGPVDQAGFRPGDSVVSVEGIPVVELGMYSRWPRALSRQPGEYLTLTVERDGELLDGRVVFGEASAGSKKLQARALFFGLCFLWGGVAVFLFSTSVHAPGILALGLALGFSLPGPDVWSWNGVRDNLQQAGIVLWALLLLRLSLTYPRRKKILTGHAMELLLFLPWVVLLGCLALELLFHPRFYHSFGWYTGILVLVYLLLALVSGSHSIVSMAIRVRRRRNPA